jgi:hypothetical protein
MPRDGRKCRLVTSVAGEAANHVYRTASRSRNPLQLTALGLLLVEWTLRLASQQRPSSFQPFGLSGIYSLLEVSYFDRVKAEVMGANSRCVLKFAAYLTDQGSC